MDPEAAPDDSEIPSIFQRIIRKILLDDWLFVGIAVTDDRSILHINAGLIVLLDGFRVDHAIFVLSRANSIPAYHKICAVQGLFLV